MEYEVDYEKQVTRLVLGYLKKECKAAYKVFLKNNFQNNNKHIVTRVQGQTLEDILRVHSRVQDIVQGRLEDTPYYKENGGALVSPIYLAEQLLYLLDRDRPFTPTSTIDERSISRCSIAETYNRSQDIQSHHIDVETTPEHTLPGNICSTEEDSRHSHTSYRQNDNLIHRTSYLDTLANPELATAMTEKMLHDNDLMQKLAQNINSVRENNNSNMELDLTVKSAVSRIEADPIFENLMQTFLEPVGQTMTKQISADPRTSPSSNSTADSTIPCNNRVEDQINGAVSSLLAVSNNLSDKEITKEVNPSSGQPSAPATTGTAKTSSTIQSSVQTQNSAPNRYPAVPQSPFFIVNPPLMIPQGNQLLTFVHPFNQNRLDVPRIQSKAAQVFTEDDITTMPTIILNDRNELSACLDPSGITLNTPHKINEVHNITEYFNVFGPSEQSPVIVKPKKTPLAKRTLKPTPTIKVEVFNRQSTPPKIITDIVNQSQEKQLPNLNTVETARKSTPADTGEVSNEKNKPTSSGSIRTPSQLVTAVKKPTPKSGTHVRNLSFPSPLKKNSTEKADNNSPSVANKQHATKDLFKTIIEESATEKKSSLKIKNKPNEMKEKPNKVTSAVKEKSVNKSTVVKKETLKSHRLWDESLRKNIIPQEPETNKTPKKPRSRNRKSVDLDVTDPDGKKLEEALKTPKSKSPKKKKIAAKVKTETVDRTRPNKGEPKIVLSPSKVYSTSKRKMDVDGVTPNFPKEVNNQPISNARKNIASLLETPLKEDLVTQMNYASTTTPFTPMLKANLKDFTEGDNFSIDTPNFPVTPGLILIENSTTPYCILNDTETNKQTEADLLSEERKSSVRKTDDDDFVLSPKLDGCKQRLDNFNKSMAGKKDLELLENKGVQWEEKSDISTSNSGDETNNTVIQQVNTPNPNVGRRSLRIAGKSMSVLKLKCLEGDSGIILEATDEAGSKDIGTSDSKDEKSLKKIGASSSSDSEIISLARYRSKEGSKKVVNNKKRRKMPNISESGDEEMIESSRTNNGENMTDHAAVSSTESIRKTLSTQIEDQFSMKTSYSVKTEMEEKRQRIIELEKSNSLGTTPSRRGRLKPKPNFNNSTPKHEKTIKKMNRCPKDSETEIQYSQDEFFKQSGSNLHRTKKDSKKMKQEENGETVLAVKDEDEIGTDKNHTDEPNESDDNSPLKETAEEQNLSDWDTFVLEEQSETKHFIYDEENASKSSIDRSFSLGDKIIKFSLPGEGGVVQTVTADVVDFISLLDIASAIDETQSPRVRNSTDLGSDRGSDSDHAKVADDAKCSKKRKNRSDSCSSNSSKRIKSSIIPKGHGEFNTAIQKVLNKLHGPNEKS